MLKELAYRLLSDRLRPKRGYGPAGYVDKKAAKYARKQAKRDAYRRGWHDPHYGGGYTGYSYGHGYDRRPKGLKGMLMEMILRYLGRRR